MTGRRRSAPTLALFCLAAALGAAAGGAAPPREDAAVLDMEPMGRWETWTTRDGLPSNRVFAVRTDGERVAAGTDAGLAVREAGRWRAYGTADGLPHPLVLSLDFSPRTGDLWIGTAGGLARLSGGRFDVYTQLNSGLSNDFVHGVRAEPDEDAVWAATAMGVCRLDLRTGSWSVYTHENTPMREPWTYAVAMGGDHLYVGAWGAGVLELTRSTGRWREFKDPDGQFEIDLLPDDGPVNDVTSGVDMSEGVLWQASYFGLARYDGRQWRTFHPGTSGLPSDFVNFVRSRGGRAYLGTDKGLAVTDGRGWAVYRRSDDGRGEVLLYDKARQIGRRLTAGSPAHNYVLSVDARGGEVWIATQEGVSHGMPGGAGPAPGAGAEDDALAEDEPAPAQTKERFRYANTPARLLPFTGATPHYELFTERPKFRGVGREEPEPTGLSEVLIGFIGPLEDTDLPKGAAPSTTRGTHKALLGRRMKRAAELALEQANAAGGYKGLPFRLVPRTDLVLWGQSSNELTGFTYEDKVWAVMSGIDSNHTHVISRGALKLEIPVVSAGSTDPTLVEHSIPWMVRCINDDRQGSIVLLNEIYRRRGLTRVAVLRVNDRDGRTGIMEFVEGAKRLGHPIIIEQRFLPGATEFAPLITTIADTDPEAVVMWGDPAETGAALRQMRAMGLKVPVFGYDRMHQREFLEEAGPAAEGVVLAATVNMDSREPDWLMFRQQYAGRWGEEPDSFAAHAYDGMNLILQAVRRAGLNRPRILDALYELGTWKGVTGPIVFDTNMSDIGPLWLATVRAGRFAYAPAPPWIDESTGTGARRTGDPAGGRGSR